MGACVQLYLERLAAFVAHKDDEIEKTCNAHYQVRSHKTDKERRTDRIIRMHTHVRSHTSMHILTPARTHTCVCLGGGRQGFVVSVDQLLSTRQVAHKLKTRVAELNTLVQEAGKDLADKVRAPTAAETRTPPHLPVCMSVCV
jgi:hypothetical protein